MFSLKQVPVPKDLRRSTPDALALMPYLISQNAESRIKKANK